MKISNFYFSKRFVDRVKLMIKGGDGGHGKPTVKGMGGNGGNIYLVGSNKVTMADLTSLYKGHKVIGHNGETLTKLAIVGMHGEHKLVKVPIGIEVCLKDGTFIGSINSSNEKMLISRGGEGGNPNNKYIGQCGETLFVRLDLKLIADVGLVGFPNAGKSTLLSKISGANVKIANYPFTTLHPQVCSIKYDDGRIITMSDLPGIVEGAHLNIGMGHGFLKHIERTKMLLFVIDLFGFRFKSTYRSVLETILLLNRELVLYDPTIINKPVICVLNKMDKNHGDILCKYIKEEMSDENSLEKYVINNDLLDENKSVICPKIGNFIKFREIISISAQTGDGIDNLKESIRQCLDEIALEELKESKENFLNQIKKIDDEFSEKGPNFV